MAEGITLKRIIDMDEAAELSSSDYALVDSSTGGPKKFALGNELSQLKEDFDHISSKMIEVKSNNLLVSDSDYTQGYVSLDGNAHGASTLGYTRKFSVSEGDIVRVFGTGGNTFQNIGIRYICAYDASGSAIPAKGAESVYEYTVPEGVAGIVITLYMAYTNKMLTVNYVPTAYETYYDPYYIASNEFVEDVLNDYEIPTIPVKGYNLIHEYEEGVGMYDRSSGKATFYDYSSYKYAIIPIKQNTNYYIFGSGRVVMLTDEVGNVLTYFGSGTPKYCVLNSGIATKLYFTANAGDFESLCVIAEGVNGINAQLKKPAFVSGLNQRMTSAKYGCALPKGIVFFTSEFNESWYFENALAIPTNNLFLFLPSTIANLGDRCINIVPNISSISNGYGYEVYDNGFALIDQKDRGYLYSKSLNLQSASVLAIGDSTVAGGQILQNMQNIFAENNKTLTMLGTRGTSPVNNEGRSGWSLADYCTVSSRDGITNPFYNDGFDFSQYMTNQGYTSPDFVIVQMGINDLYNFTFANGEALIDTTISYLSEIIESIFAYNSSQKIIINLPVGVNTDWSKHSVQPELVRNKVIRYNEKALALISKYTQDIIRASYCHLILDQSTDIRDDVHPTDGGYAKMANEIVSQINCWQN